ncbi:UNVERIFIED_CONTAM: hypothetical protein Sradi_2017500 [Sesamum radiatum]|uniref:Glycine-rich protein n=1 Tax=Sesamum radiatum TaxID=300843 RepID=A0AAW2TGU5_SESRA
MGSKAIIFLIFFLATVLLISSEVAARELAQTSTAIDASKEAEKTNGAAVDDVKYPGGGYGGYPGGGYGGYPGGGVEDTPEAVATMADVGATAATGAVDGGTMEAVAAGAALMLVRKRVLKLRRSLNPEKVCRKLLV